MPALVISGPKWVEAAGLWPLSTSALSSTQVSAPLNTPVEKSFQDNTTAASLVPSMGWSISMPVVFDATSDTDQGPAGSPVADTAKRTWLPAALKPTPAARQR